MDWISDPAIWTSLLTLTALEIVLGVDNVVFISILASKLPKAQQDRARLVGLGGAMIMRILLLFSISWLIGLTEPLFSLFDRDFSGRDLILLTGGLFLIYKATTEIHEKLEGHEAGTTARAAVSFISVIVQIMLLDIVFSIDSVITAVGMADELSRIFQPAGVVRSGTRLARPRVVRTTRNREQGRSTPSGPLCRHRTTDVAWKGGCPISRLPVQGTRHERARSHPLPRTIPTDKENRVWQRSHVWPSPA